MKRILLISTFIFCCKSGAFSQLYSAEAHVVDQLKNFVSTYDPEKAYVQFDRPYYAAGDTIYFKAYVTQGGRHKLSISSGVLHVDLINPENRIEQSIRLRLDSGVCWGDFALPDSLPTGNYRVRAYTQWMRNLGELDFFDQNMYVRSISKQHVPDQLIKQTGHGKINNADLQFFPEGGNLVEAVETKLAFKAIGKNGLSIHAKGVILDKGNMPVCSIESSRLGMGYIMFKPEKGELYKAKLSFDDGTQNTIDLPRPEASGISLAVDYDSNSTISIKITANGAYYLANRNKDFLLVIYSGGKVMSYSFKQEDPRITLSMDRKLLQTGVSTISLFSPEGEPLCERLLFVQHNDQLSLQMHADKAAYKKKEKVDLQLNAKSPTGLSVNGNFSVTVVYETPMPADENNERNILTYLLLTSDLTGYVEQPNYYFKDTSAEARDNLDLLMLTQGYRNFEWKQELGKDSLVLAFQRERGLEVTGKITNLSDKPISNGTVTLIPSSGGNLLSAESDPDGLFRFSNLVFTDTARLVLSAVNSKGSNSTRITYLNTKQESPVVIDQPYFPPIMEDIGMLSYFGEAKKIREEVMADDPKYKMLKSVTVRAVKLDNQYRTQSLAGAGHADQVMHATDIEMVGGQLSTSLNGRLHGVSFIGGIPYLTASGSNVKSPMLLVLDGTEFRAGPNFNVDDISTSQVETIEVLKYASESIYGMDGAAGVLVITTKNGGKDPKDIVSIGVLPITPMGFYKARTFYSPKYEYASGNATVPELRFTIYWNPELKTDQDGMVHLEYYNAERKGTYKVIVEGIDQNGNVGRLVYRYPVE